MLNPLTASNTYKYHQVLLQKRYTLPTEYILCAVSGFRRDVDEICALLAYYATLSGSYVLTFRNNLSIPSSRIKKSKPLEDRTDRLSQNVGT